MRKLLLFFFVSLISSCAVYNGATIDDLYHSGARVQHAYVDPDRGYLRMRAASPRWRAFDDDFHYWNFGPGLVGVGNPMGGWNTWRWYSPGFPVYGTSPWMPYSIYGTWGPHLFYQNWGVVGTWGHAGAWTPYRTPPRRQAPEPRQFNLGAYGAGQRVGGQTPTRTFGTQQPAYQPSTGTQGRPEASSARSGSPARTFGTQQPAYQPRTATQGQPRTGAAPGSAPVRKFDRP